MQGNYVDVSTEPPYFRNITGLKFVLKDHVARTTLHWYRLTPAVCKWLIQVFIYTMPVTNVAANNSSEK